VFVEKLRKKFLKPTSILETIELLLIFSLFVNFHFSLVLGFMIPFTLTHLFMIIFIGAVLVFKWKRIGSWVVENKVLFSSITIFLLWSVLAFFWAYYKKDVIETSVKWGLALLLIPVFSIVYKDKKNSEKALKLIFYGGAFLGVLGLFEYLFMEKSDFLFMWFREVPFHPRVSTTFNNVNSYGAFLSVVSGVGFVLLGNKKINKKQFFLCESGIILGIALSGSRNAFLCFLFCITLASFYFRHMKGVVLSFIVIFLIFIFTVCGFGVSAQRIGLASGKVIPWFDNTVGKFTQFEAVKLEKTDISTDPSFGVRLDLYKAALRCFIENPFGIGSGNFVYRHTEFLEKVFTVGIGNFHAHNIFLNILAEQGILGALFFSTIIFTIIKRGKRSPLLIIFLSVLFVQQLDFFMNNNAQMIFLFGFSSALSLLKNKDF